MPRITPIHWRTLAKVFEADGWVFSRTRGDHHIYCKPGCPRPIVIPAVSEVMVDIIHNNMRTAGMSRDRYLELLDAAE